MGLLAGKVAVVTGSGRGVGRAVVHAFAEEGAAVTVSARSQNEIDSVAEEIRVRGGRALAVQADIANQRDVDNLFARVLAELGPVDVLVNNAATSGPSGMVWETQPAAWQDTLDINVVGAVRCVRAVAPTMIARRYGKIIIVGSVAGRDSNWAATFPELAAYGVSKAAIIHFSTCLAAQLKPYGINVNCVGVYAQTRLSFEHNQAVAQLRGQAHFRLWDELPAEKRVRSEENVGVFVFLASALSDHITGQYIEANSQPGFRGAGRDRS